MRTNPYEEAIRKKGKPLFIPFVVLGDPDRGRSLDVIRALVESGADALELGFPFSDPPADGPVIQAADARALRSGIRIDDCFAMLKEIRSLTKIPVGLLVYYNLVLQRGVGEFYRECAASGIDSVLIADVPLEHASEILPAAKKHGVLPVFLVSDVTTDERMKAIADIAGGYLYVVSYLGVTGVDGAANGSTLRETIERVRRHSKLPLFVGFGINTPQQARSAVASGADGVIVGSRIVKEIERPEEVSRIAREIAECL